MIDKILTICLPAYNGEQYIKECIISILNCNHKDRLQILAVNDGSKDGTKDIVTALAQQYPDIIEFYDRENGGTGAVYNFCIPKAQGRYFMIVDQDDRISTKELDRFIEDIELCQSDLITYRLVRFGRKNGEGQSITNLDYKKEYLCDEVYTRLNMFIHNIAFRTEVLQNNGIKADDAYVQYCDTSLVLRATPYLKTVTCFDEEVYEYRINTEQGMSARGVVHYIDALELVLKFVYDYYENALLENKLSKEKMDYISGIASGTIATVYDSLSLVWKGRSLRVKRLNEWVTDEALWSNTPLSARIIRLNNPILNTIVGCAYYIYKRYVWHG